MIIDHGPAAAAKTPRVSLSLVSFLSFSPPLVFFFLMVEHNIKRRRRGTFPVVAPRAVFLRLRLYYGPTTWFGHCPLGSSFPSQSAIKQEQGRGGNTNVRTSSTRTRAPWSLFFSLQHV